MKVLKEIIVRSELPITWRYWTVYIFMEFNFKFFFFSYIIIFFFYYYMIRKIGINNNTGHIFSS